jgi:hypothetical protein
MSATDYNKFVYDKGFCCDKFDKLLFDNIQMYDYLEPIKRLKDYYKTTDNKYYVELHKQYESYEFETPMSIMGYNYDLDEIILQYASCFSDIKMIIFFTCNDEINTMTPVISQLLASNNNSIHCYKKFLINGKQYYPLVYQLSWHNYESINFDYVKRKTNNLGISGKCVTVNVLLCNNNNFDNIKNTLDKGGCDCLSVENRSYVLDLVKLFFNKNSIRLLQYQRVDRLLYGNYNSSLSLLMSYKNWINQEIKPIDQIRFMIFSSGVLFTLGIRNMRDIDLIANWGSHVPDTVTKYLVNPETKFPFIDVHIRKEGKWYANDKHQEYLSEWFDKEWPSLYGATSMEDTIFNPKHHYYYCGVKLISMKADITRRIKRNRAAAFADLIALIMFTNIEIPIIKLDSGCWKEHVYYEYTDAEIKKMIKTVKYYMQKKYRVKMSTEEICKYIQINQS